MLDHIEIFVQLVTLGSFARTAEQLHIAPSTLSRKIHELEMYFDKLLIIRDTRNLSLTADGEIVYQKFKHLPNLLGSVKKIINPIAATKNDELNIVLPLVHALELITPHISYFNKIHPEIKLNLFYQNVKPNVKSDSFDVAITEHPIDNPKFKQNYLRTEFIQLYCTPSYATKYGLPIIVDDLNEHRVIGGIDAANNLMNYPILTNKYTSEYFIYDSTKDSIKCNSAIHSLQIGLAGEYIFPCWSFLCDELVKKGELVQVLSEYYGYKSDLYLVTGKSVRVEEQLFIDFVYRCMNRMIAIG